MTSEELLHKFKKDFGYLEKFGLQIWGVYGNHETSHQGEGMSFRIGEYIAEDYALPETHLISIMRPFVFDNRKIPKTYMGFRVRSAILTGGNLSGEYITYPMPEEFNDEEEPWDIEYAPEKFIAFVDRCADEIRETLDDPDMTKKEMLDALAFGDFKKHKKKCEELKIERLCN